MYNILPKFLSNSFKISLIPIISMYLQAEPKNVYIKNQLDSQ